jgi:hypothetical protein
MSRNTRAVTHPGKLPAQHRWAAEAAVHGALLKAGTVRWLNRGAWSAASSMSETHGGDYKCCSEVTRFI